MNVKPLYDAGITSKLDGAGFKSSKVRVVADTDWMQEVNVNDARTMNL